MQKYLTRMRAALWRKRLFWHHHVPVVREERKPRLEDRFTTSTRQQMAYRILQFLDGTSSAAVTRLSGHRYLIGLLPNGCGVALVWEQEGEAHNRVLTWAIRNAILREAHQTPSRLPIFICATANTAPLDTDL